MTTEHTDIEQQILRRYPEIRKVTVVGAVVNTILAILKIWIGFIGHSQALVADGIHSFSDLVTDGLVLLSAKHGSKEADEDHPYGHGRIETAATVVLGTILIFVGIGLCVDAYHRLLGPEVPPPHPVALIIALVSVIAKEGLFHYTRHVAKRLRSNLLHANAWHHRTDAISSVIVVIGVGAALTGWPHLDAIAAIAVALMIMHIGWKLGFHSVQELVDTALHPERIAAIRRHILLTPGVKHLHMLRTRRMGGNALVDVHIQVDAKLTVSEGHLIGEKVREVLLQQIDEVNDVTVHIDPEDDETVRPSAMLPPRQEITDQLNHSWRKIPESRQVRDIRLHYLDGQIEVEVTLPLEAVKDIESAKTLAVRFARSADEHAEVRRVRVLFE